MNDFRTFWKFPVELSNMVVVRNGWTAVGCSMPCHLSGLNRAPKQLHAVGGKTIYGRISRQNPGEPWRALVLSDDGTVIVWTDRERHAFLFAFDIIEAVEDLLAERYREQDTRASRVQLLHRAYYRARPFIPRALQMVMKRAYVGVQSKAQFPAWPIDHSVKWMHDLLAWCVAEAYDGPAVPYIGFWPGASSFCAVLTHDVETGRGVANIAPLVEIEKRHGFRSCWNFVPERYSFNRELLLQLQSDGFEIGVHGLTHDGRLFESHRMFVEKAERINAYAREWGASGFRSPACHRNHEWMRADTLQFAYDSSYPDSDPYQPMPGGCCSVFPWFLGDKVELPITLPQDHVIFDICGGESADLWLEKLAHVESVGGMALVIVHPDYMLDPMRLRAYESFLVHLKSRPSMWCALPREVAQWWRVRAKASISLDGHEKASVSTSDHEFGGNALQVDWFAAGDEPGDLIPAILTGSHV